MLKLYTEVDIQHWQIQRGQITHVPPCCSPHLILLNRPPQLTKIHRLLDTGTQRTWQQDAFAKDDLYRLIAGCGAFFT